MDGNTVIFMVLSGLCILPSCFPQLYHIVEDAKTWTEAQSYCREKHTDLVTINSEEDMVRLSHMLWDNDDDEFWIGLYGDFNNWKWSLERKGFYKEGEAEFRKWYHSEPNTYTGPSVCVDIATSGVWSDTWCNSVLPFVCYNEFSENRYIYVRTRMKWADAQRYCRENYTDLASVRNATENEKIRMILENFAWIGLYRESWKWSDGQRMQMTSFSNWNKGQPDKIIGHCATTTHSKWSTRPCNNKYAFVCSGRRKQVVKVMLTKSDSSVDLEEMQDVILQQFTWRLKDFGLGEDVRLNWIKQPDGKIFHLKETEEGKEKEKRKGKDTDEKSCISKN